MRVNVFILWLLTLAGGAIAQENTQQSTSSRDRPTSMPTPSFVLPDSNLLSDESAAAHRQWTQFLGNALRACASKGGSRAVTPVYRNCIDEQFSFPLIARHRARYAVAIQSATIAGVAAEVITPVAGVARENSERVLINLHGGGFTSGGRWGGQIESIPIAAVGRIKVISVDYRLAPEHRFPAASEDVASVYREVLKTHAPVSIGIYGCSAGALLTAQTIAWLQHERLPLPGAIGMFCAAAAGYSDGDSNIVAAATGSAIGPIHESPYFAGADMRSPLVLPAQSPDVMKQFPPSLLISATRDFALSSVVHSHSMLTRLGVPAELHVWEGLNHTFVFDPDQPAAREAYDVIVRFFDRHLASKRQ